MYAFAVTFVCDGSDDGYERIAYGQKKTIAGSHKHDGACHRIDAGVEWSFSGGKGRATISHYHYDRCF
ncbi:hypothetical protein GCM10010885_07090 [Alicyclobacillus cellulosilyticus]|uniref:Uncharacterized protein n=1 Tax=Alicyclobacillus cellulosilyticus TaxID=1003997 RepID=A0A917NH98_9BACL|nr:hypothetical protein GCM10010885_07090 [Alicyclobacillus cellulosilyticus]